MKAVGADIANQNHVEGAKHGQSVENEDVLKEEEFYIISTQDSKIVKLTDNCDGKKVPAEVSKINGHTKNKDTDGKIINVVDKEADFCIQDKDGKD